MKTKTLFLAIAFATASIMTATAQKLLVSEDFSSALWQQEFTRLNPGTDVNPNALNPKPYSKPEKGFANAYINLNRKELYFNKYKLQNAVESFTALPCALGVDIKHQNENLDVALRFHSAAQAQFEFPKIPNAGAITLHVRNGNKTEGTSLGLEKFENGKWLPIHSFELQKNSAYKTIDEIVTYDLNSATPIKLRLINNVSETKRFIYLFRVDIAAKN